MNAASPAPAAQPIPVFDLHCDTADRLSWQFLSGSLRKAAGMHFYGPGDEADPAGCRQLARNHGAISVEKVGATPWAQCFACFVPDELSPEEALIKQLTEYKQFKEASERMHQLEEEARALMTKMPEEYPLPPPNIEITGLTLDKLVRAFQRVLARAEASEQAENMANREIRRDQFTVSGCMSRIARKLRGGRFAFSELFDERMSRAELITMFSALLEMAKLGRVHIEQQAAYEEIYLSPE